MLFYFQAAVSALFWLSQFCTLKKNRDRLRAYSKICNFVTYQIAFLMTCQQHKSRNVYLSKAVFFCISQWIVVFLQKKDSNLLYLDPHGNLIQSCILLIFGFEAT